MVHIEQYLENLKSQLFQPNNWQQIVMTRRWAESIPEEAGVYVMKENDKIVYVGETGNLQGRMYDLLDSRHHTVRRTIGEKLFSNEEGFTKATTRKKFPEHIEELVNNHICTNLYLAYLEVQLGRKELEEFIESDIEVETRLNKRGKRKKKKRK
ncbi:GIY-YIG nuclease family protein [Flavobacterium longum]|uniref:GIY-YIG nuclease family protein n=1 Tax=Flavobacterium longum TaxID=1299340 RepID=UPI0039E96EC8